jgi:aryl-alcohol dehydrogenase-like predicted oxidoreductase
VRPRTDYLDIYWLHMWDRYTPIEETLRALDDEARADRILYVGISDTPAWLIARARGPAVTLVMEASRTEVVDVAGADSAVLGSLLAQ